MNKNSNQIEKVKLNLSNIHSILVRDNENREKIISKKEKLFAAQKSKKKLEKEEKKLESPIKSSLDKVKESSRSSSKSSGGSIFDKILKFGGLLLTGIIVNALPAIIEKVKEIIDTITNFLTPIQSGFNLIMGFFTGELNDSKLDADKKRFDDGINHITGKDGLLDKIAEKMGPFGGLIKMLKPAISSVSDAIGGKKIVLAKKDGKEGVLNRETGVFTEKQFTSQERKRYTRDSDTQNQDSDDSPGPINDTQESIDGATVVPDDDHSVNTPKSGGRSNTGFVPGTNPKIIYFHWSGGIGYVDRPAAYHSYVDGAGKIHYNSPYTIDKKEHTWKRNTNSVAIAAAAMGHVGQDVQYIEAKGWAQTPLKHIQVNTMTLEAAKLALAWGWKENDINIKNIMTHAEAAGNRDGRSPTVNYGPGPSGQGERRWDLWYLTQGGAKWSGGEIMRGMIKQHMRNLNKQNDKSDASGGPEDTIQRSSYKPIIDERKMAAINQPMYEDLDDEEEMINVYIQPINTVRTQYSYQPIPA
tara:strand:+ start:5861 stop:7441 length:1581 start_codon:yes stop_codon:yes gene_type:complete